MLLQCAFIACCSMDYGNHGNRGNYVLDGFVLVILTGGIIARLWVENFFCKRDKYLYLLNTQTKYHLLLCWLYFVCNFKESLVVNSLWHEISKSAIFNCAIFLQINKMINQMIKVFISFIISIEMSAFIFISEHTKNKKNQ